MSAAFKEWAIVCEALGSGRQSILIRKGGVAEGRSGFAYEHSEFFLFPTNRMLFQFGDIVADIVKQAHFHRLPAFTKDIRKRFARQLHQ